MIWFDVTQASASSHRSGLMRVSGRLRDELGAAVREFAWPRDRGGLRGEDWLLEAELFDEADRPGIGAFLAAPPCRLAAVYYDAIPLKFPHITWPRSVERHPAYLKLLSRFDRVWAISAASRAELLAYWDWLGLSRVPAVEVLPMGADFNRLPRVGPSTPARPPARPARLLSVGIVEPRKNQDLLLDVCGELWDEGHGFELHLAGRVNPHFGRPIESRIEAAAAVRPGLHFHRAPSDATLAELYATARAVLAPTLAEGSGLPVLESLWTGVPCVCSEIPSLLENAAGGGCLTAPAEDRAGWKTALAAILSDDALHARLASEARSRPLATWADSAAALAAGLGR